MNVLAFDTCFSACSVAVSGGPAGGIVSEHRALETGHAEALLPMIECAMGTAGIAFADLDRIVVTHGPGSFTGVRTGVAAARALALATGAAIVAVSSLWALAQAALAAKRSSELDGVLVVMDARKGEVYAQVFDREGRALTEPQVLAPDAALQLVPKGHFLATGNAVSPVLAALDRGALEMTLLSVDADATLNSSTPDARFLLTAPFGPAGQGLGDVRPLYLRAPDAKPQSAKSLPWSTP